MLISDKQREANRRNAAHSTGPKTPEGKAAIRSNALTYGLRTRATILEREDAAVYAQLWDELAAAWQPQDRTEWCYLETLVTSQWLLKRVAESESRIYDSIAFGEERFKMLAYVVKQRAQLERSFRTAVADLRQSQKERHARQPQTVQTAQTAQTVQTAASPASPASSGKPAAPPPDYLMSEGAAVHPVFSAPISPDTR